MGPDGSALRSPRSLPTAEVFGGECGLRRCRGGEEEALAASRPRRQFSPQNQAGSRHAHNASRVSTHCLSRASAREAARCCSFAFLCKPLRSVHPTLTKLEPPWARAAHSGQWAPALASCSESQSRQSRLRAVGLWRQPPLERCPCCPSKHLGTWTSWGWGPNTRGAAESAPQSPWQHAKPDQPAACRKY